MLTAALRPLWRHLIQHHIQLENGLTLLAEHVRTPSISFDLRMRCGSSADPHGARGAAHALEGWLWKGAGGFSARELGEAQDDLGLQRGGGAGFEYTRMSANLLSSDLEAAFALFAKVLLEPHLHAEDLEPLLELSRQDLLSLEDSPPDKLFSELRGRFYSSGHRDPVQGTLESLDNLTPEVVASLRSRHTPQGATLALAGNFDWEEVVRLVQKYFGGWSGEKVALEPVVLAPHFTGHLEQDSHQTHLALQYAGVHPSSSDWYAFILAQNVLSGNSSSRLFAEVREKRGLAYSVFASSELMGPLGFLSAYAGTTPERADETLTVLRSEIENLHLGVSAEELERSRISLLSSLIQSGESARARCGSLGRDFSWFGRTRTLEEVERALREVTLGQVNGFLESYPLKNPSILTLGRVMQDTAVMG